ncbi:hypothetical protein PSTEL_00440 [Paenibacillus stellifer]|uniref:Integrase n=1 Tax=Paenibacillus stellifer TaxID=169760 RepID=A0A089MZJ9_9BACL|nr:site-specific integrase [Paenibacillus stellifer]AIQ61829.1 hypothetical protein PSTEL_00440 [Paenibacillus stellifer]
MDNIVKKSKKKKKLPPGVRERDGRYTYRYNTYVTENGKKKRKFKETASYSNPADAYEAGILIKASQIQGTYVDEKNISFGDWADKWFEMYEQSDRKDHTIVTRKSRMNVLKKEFGDYKLKEITPLQYQEYLFRLKKSGKEKNTILGLHSTMTMIVKKAARPPYEIIAKDFTTGVEIPKFKESVQSLKEGKPKELYLEKEELAVFINTAYAMAEHAENDHERMIARQCARALHILSYTGLRIGELCALDEDDIDEENKKINIIKTLNVQHGIENYILDTPKNETSIREVDVTSRVIALFREQAIEKKKARLMFGQNFYKKEDFVFVNMHRKPGCPLSPLEIARYMAEVLREAGVCKKLSPHKLRHTYTSLSAEAGIELAAIQRQLGHANDRMTTQVYLHVTKSIRRTNVEKLESLMDHL